MDSGTKPGFGNWQKYLDMVVSDLTKIDRMGEFHSLKNNVDKINFIHQVTDARYVELN